MNSLQARESLDDLRRQLRTVPYNADLSRYLRNIEKMVVKMNSLEVEAQRRRSVHLYHRHAEETAAMIKHLGQLILIAVLMA